MKRLDNAEKCITRSCNYNENYQIKGAEMGGASNASGENRKECVIVVIAGRKMTNRKIMTLGDE
jgi:hypothetical protein